MGPANVYAIVAVPVLILIICEVIYCLYKKNNLYGFQDSVMGIGTMFMAQCLNVALVGPIMVTYTWIYDHWALFHFENTGWTLVLGYIGSDFLFYWFHRAGHRINIFWAAHVPHHSAEELNYAVALRASLTQRGASFLFYWPLCVLGFTPTTVITIVAINLVYQLLPHTRIIKHYPRWIEAWLNSPYHHQVHHAANPIYWDKNYGGTLIIWDKMFGTYQEQVEPLYYGVSVPPKSWNPFYINFHWYLCLWKDALVTKSWLDKFKIWIKPPSWRPRDLPQHKQLPLMGYVPEPKYTSAAFKGANLYLCAQVLLAFYTLSPVISHETPLNGLQMTSLSALIFFQVYIWSLFLEAKPYAKWLETLRLVTLVYLMMKFPVEIQYPYMKVITMLSSIASWMYMYFFIDSRVLQPAPPDDHIVLPLH